MGEFGGWIKLHRRLMDNAYSKEPEMMTLVVHCLLMANHRDNEFIWNGRVMKVEKGSFITSYAHLSAKSGVSVRKIRLRLEALQKTGFLTIKTTNKYSVISVCNYDRYQSGDNGDMQDDKQTAIKRQTDGNKQECIKNEKNEKKDIPTDPLPKYVPLLDLLETHIKGFNPNKKFKPNWRKAQGKAIRLLVEADNADPKDVERILRWLPTAPTSNGGFSWGPNILSGVKLRKQFDKLMAAQPKGVAKSEAGLGYKRYSRNP